VITNIIQQNFIFHIFKAIVYKYKYIHVDNLFFLYLPHAYVNNIYEEQIRIMENKRLESLSRVTSIAGKKL
jgi:hypothetical protein